MAGGERADLDFSCTCGAVAGVLDGPGPDVGDHVVCHCTDCEAFATRLGAAPHILDAQGGIALYQGRCATMRLTTGRERLACLHLTKKPTLRWYAACCDTPMFNTYRNGRIPYITVVVANCEAKRREALLGAPMGHLFLKEATGDVVGLRPLTMFTLMRRFSLRMIADLLGRQRRRSALFDPATLAPIAVPEQLGEAIPPRR